MSDILGNSAIIEQTANMYQEKDKSETEPDFWLRLKSGANGKKSFQVLGDNWW